jgi:hypothetical protein
MRHPRMLIRKCPSGQSMSGQPMNVNIYRSERDTRGIVYTGMETTDTEFTSVMTLRRTETITPNGPQAGLNLDDGVWLFARSRPPGPMQSMTDCEVSRHAPQKPPRSEKRRFRPHSAARQRIGKTQSGAVKMPNVLPQGNGFIRGLRLGVALRFLLVRRRHPGAGGSRTN